jgi:organic hydroperoxide reductase OsmC/OhrA
MIQLEKVLYTAKAHTTTGGQDGASHSSDDRLDAKPTSPDTPGAGTNPEQLFAARWSTYFLSAIEICAGKTKVTRPADLAVDTEVDPGTTTDSPELERHKTLLNVEGRISSFMGIALRSATASFAQQVKTDYDRSADFSQYRTYSWDKVHTQNTLWVDRIKAAVNSALAAKGWRQDAAMFPSWRWR